MPASNHNWVCFQCRTAVRRPNTNQAVPKCMSCGNDCYCLGYKVAIPKKSDIKAWRQINDFIRDRDFAVVDFKRIQELRRKHDLEKEIFRMELLDENKDRSRLIKKLKDQLKRLQNLS